MQQLERRIGGKVKADDIHMHRIIGEGYHNHMEAVRVISSNKFFVVVVRFSGGTCTDKVYKDVVSYILDRAELRG